jgi:arsenate reductase
MTLKYYHNPRCSKSRAALQLLRDRGIEPVVVEYLETPPSAEELRRIVDLLGIPPRQLLRRKEAREAGLDVDRLDDDALIAAMIAHPIVIERPIAVTETAARIGRPPENVLEIV